MALRHPLQLSLLDRPIHSFFEDWAARTPAAPAAVFVPEHGQAASYTYAELNARANRLAHWLRLQWQEEVGHATRLLDYVLRRGGRVSLEGIDKPPAKFGSILTMFEQVLEHEQGVTARIHKLVDQATAEKDHATTSELQWFVNEQVEEEEQASRNVDLLKTIGKQQAALLLFDRRLAERAAG